MKTYALCPISDKKVNERVARLNAGITVMLLLFFIITHNIITIIFMTIDFFLRATGYSKLSPVSIISKYIIKWLPLKDHSINAGPKILAARIGLIFSTLIIVSLLMSFSYLSLFIAGILGLFSFLEGAFGLCVACQIYPFVYRFLYT
jgi:Domain of unknown function (DUF4395)